MYGKRLRPLALTTFAALTLTLALAFFWAPNDADQGFLQKIFYIHVPLAIVTLCGFVYGGIAGIAHLRTRDSRWDMRSYVAIHLSLVFGVGVLVTGSIWAKGSWGVWWDWSEPTLVSFLLIMLLYATYQPLRFAIEDPERQARYASVFAITAGAFVPINFVIVRLSTAYLHPRVLGNISANLPGRFQIVFYLSLLSMALLWITLWRYEMTSKHASAQLRALKRSLGGDDDETLPRRSAVPTVTVGIGATPAARKSVRSRAGTTR
ncbi:MAG: cytochrome c biogenesis protein [Solirubrobacteraceae bacterium]